MQILTKKLTKSEEEILGFLFLSLEALNPVNVKELVEKEVNKRVEEQKKKEASSMG